MQQWLECNWKCLGPQSVVGQGLELITKWYTREAPVVSQSPMDMVGPAVPAKSCAGKSGSAALSACLFLPHNCEQSRSSHSLHKKITTLGQAQHLLATRLWYGSDCLICELNWQFSFLFKYKVDCNIIVEEEGRRERKDDKTCLLCQRYRNLDGNMSLCVMYFLCSVIERGMHISLDARDGNQNLRVLLSYHLESR